MVFIKKSTPFRHKRYHGCYEFMKTLYQWHKSWGGRGALAPPLGFKVSKFCAISYHLGNIASKFWAKSNYLGKFTSKFWAISCPSNSPNFSEDLCFVFLFFFSEVTLIPIEKPSQFQWRPFFFWGHLNLDRKTDRFSGKIQSHFSGKSLVPPQILLSSYAHALYGNNIRDTSFCNAITNIYHKMVLKTFIKTIAKPYVKSWPMSKTKALHSTWSQNQCVFAFCKVVLAMKLQNDFAVFQVKPFLSMESNISLYSMNYAEACNEFAGSISASLCHGSTTFIKEMLQQWHLCVEAEQSWCNLSVRHMGVWS